MRCYVDLVLDGTVPRPDFAVYVEPTCLDVYTAQIGFFIAEVAVTGKSAYFGRPELGIDALRAAHSVLAAVWEHAAALEALPAHDMIGKSSLLVTSITGGGYIAVPESCEFAVIRKLRPQEDLEGATAAFEQAVAGAPVADGIRTSISYPAGRDHERGGTPCEIAPDHADALALSQAVQAVAPSKGSIGGAPYWSEIPFLLGQLDCPAVYCAPGDISCCHTVEERISIDEYLEAVRAYALFDIAHCGAEDRTIPATMENAQ